MDDQDSGWFKQLSKTTHFVQFKRFGKPANLKTAKGSLKCEGLLGRVRLSRIIKMKYYFSIEFIYDEH